MNYLILIIASLLLCIIILGIIVSKYDKQKNELKLLQLNYSELKKTKRQDLKKLFEEEWKQEQEIYEVKANGLNAQLAEKEKRYEEVNQDLDLYRKGKIKEIDSAGAEYEQHKYQIIEQSINIYRDELIEKANQFIQTAIDLKEEKEKELEQVQAELEVERNKRAAINEEIRRQREVEEQQDFYKIQLNPDDIEDIKLLRSVTPRLRHPEAINKVIWTGYYQKPLAELRKRAGIDGSGVYKITRLKTGEIYIGQAVNISTRWAEHCKTALGVGTLASSQLHRTMSEDGCENFTFELLEAVPKDKLRERESYYIDFYDSKTYGLNTLSGDKNK